MSKLTLSVDSRVVLLAKRYARSSATVSISKMVETYLAAQLSTRRAPSTREAPILRLSLRGLLKKAGIEEYKKHLAAKYR